mmetsp:Transcript_15258/g.40965  ORF Transcript_15258/g.40965 Transcript_15258/m.40965 type:complete len:399 (-) Transcript_15258:1326-2522(-)
MVTAMALRRVVAIRGAVMVAAGTKRWSRGGTVARGPGWARDFSGNRRARNGARAVKMTGALSDYSELQIEAAQLDVPENILRMYYERHAPAAVAVASLLEELGAPKTDLQRLVITRPELAQRDLMPAIKTLMSQGVAVADLPRALRRMSTDVLAHGLEVVLLPKVATLAELGLSSQAIANALTVSQSMLSQVHHRHVLDTVEAFRCQLGVPQQGIASLFTTFPRALDLKPELVRRQREQLNLLGVPDSMLTPVVVAHPQLLLFARRSKYQPLLEFFKAAGVPRSNAAILVLAVLPKLVSSLTAAQAGRMSQKLADSFDDALGDVVASSTRALDAVLATWILPRMRLLGIPSVLDNGVLPPFALESNSDFVANHLPNVKLSEYLRFVTIVSHTQLGQSR